VKAKIDQTFRKHEEYGEVSADITLSPYEWSIFEKHLAKIGVKFRSPNR
jgi:hypothetical protein